MLRRRNLVLISCFLLGAVGCSQQATITHGPALITGTPQLNADSTTSNAEQERKRPAKERRGVFVGVPVPVSSPAIGSGATLLGGYIFQLRRNDKVSRPSLFGGAALFTNNGTRAFILGTELYFRQDQYHFRAAVAHGDLKYDFYGIGNANGDAGRKFGLTQTGSLFFGEAMRRIGWKIYVGPRAWIATSSLAARKVGETHPELPTLNTGFDIRSLGFKVERDTVPNRFYPEKGTSLLFSADFFSKALGGSFTFQSYQLKFNAYRSVGPKQVFAYNAFVCSTAGKAPFFGQCIFGMQNELRGYPAGRYIDQKMLATQFEYRRVLPWRFGVVGFAGLGEVAPTFGKFNYDNLLGSVGGGLRFCLSKKYHVNIRADVAQGKVGRAFSMGLGEAF